MLTIIESLCPPIRYFPNPGEKLKPGTIAQIIQVDGFPHITTSDGSLPFGIIGEHADQPHGLIPIWYESMLLRTTCFESKESYKKDDPLYCSVRGLITSLKPNESSQLLGHVVEPPGTEDPFLELSWI